MQEFDQRSTLDPTLAGAVWRYRWLVAIIVVVTGVLAYAYASYTAVEAYTAVASVQVEDPQANSVFDSGVRARRDEYVADQVTIIASGEVARRAVDIALSIDSTYPYVTGDMLDRTNLSGGNDSSVIFIRFRADEPGWAALGANSLINAYKALLSEETRAFYGSSIELLDETIGELDAEIEQIRNRIIQITVSDDPARARINEQFDEAVAALSVLVDERDRANADRIVQIRQEIDDIIQQFDAIRALTNIEQDSPELSELAQRQTRAIQRLDDLAERRDRIALDSQLLSSGVRVTTPAAGANVVEGNLQRIIIVGLFLGVLLGAGLAYMLALRRRNITERGQPEIVLNAPLIAEVPSFKQEGIKDPLPVRSQPRSASAEAFRFAAASLDLALGSAFGRSRTAGQGGTRHVSRSEGRQDGRHGEHRARCGARRQQGAAHRRRLR